MLPKLKIVVYYWHFYYDLQLKSTKILIELAPGWTAGAQLRLLVSTKRLLVNRWQATRFCFDLPTTMMMMMNVTNPHPIVFLHSLKKYFFLLTYFVGSFISFYHFFLDLWILLSSKLKLVFLFRLLAVFF